MTNDEFETWTRMNPVGLTLRETTMRPCSDCPASYAAEMAALGCCNGEPGLAMPVVTGQVHGEGGRFT